MLQSCQTLSLAAINFTPEWNLHPWEFSYISDDLYESFNINGIIHPPVVIAVDSKRYSIVTGAKRLHFQQKKYGDSSFTNCMVIEKGTSPANILNIILADHGYATSLSLAEKARFIEIALNYIPIEKLHTSFAARLQLPKGREILKVLQKLLLQDLDFIAEVHNGVLQDKMVTKLLSLSDKKDRQALVSLFRDLAMGDGKQKKFFNLIRDNAYREDLSIIEYLHKGDVTDILKHQEMNIPQKIQNLGNLLQKETSPSSSRAEGQFLKRVKTLQLAPNQSISHTPFFEKDEVTLSITFKNFADCQHYLKQQ